LQCFLQQFLFHLLSRKAEGQERYLPDPSIRSLRASALH
jgi:hypothetical protein